MRSGPAPPAQKIREALPRATGRTEERFPGILPALASVWLLYLTAVILGGGFLLVQLVSGHHDAFGHDFDPHHPGGGEFFSARSALFGLTAFGLVGAPLEGLRILGSLPTLAVAASSAIAASAGTAWVFRAVRRTSESGAAALEELYGQPGRVLVSCGPLERGKVRLSLKGHWVDLLATSRDAPIQEGARVRVVDVRGNEVLVEPMKPGRSDDDPSETE